MAGEFFNTTRQDDRFRPFYGFEGLPIPPLLHQFVGPFLQQQAGQLGMMPFGLSGRNYYDRLEDLRLSMMHGRMIRQAAEADRATYMAQLRGVAALTGTPWDSTRQQAAHSLANRMIGAAPFMTSVAPEVLDAMAGFRGSTAVMAEFAFQGARSRMDPVTGGVGLSQESLDRLLSGMQARLSYSRDGGQLTNLSLGETGRLFQHLQRQGLIRGTGLQDLPIDDVRAKASELGIDFSKGLRGLSSRDTARLAEGLDTRLRDVDAGRVTDTLKKYQGAIAAVREIFGDAGRPNAPMAELVSALNNLTSGGIGQIDPSRMDQMVRTTYNLAKRSGMGLENVGLFQETLAQQARAMGLPTPYAATVTQGALAFGQAYQAVGYGGTPVFGQGNIEHQRALFAQQQMAAAGSVMANQIGLLTRLDEISGGKAFQAGSQASRYIERIRAGSPIDAMTDAEFLKMVSGSATDGFQNQGRLLDMLNQKQSNMEYGFRHGADRLARLAQRDESRKFLAASSRHTAQREAGLAGLNETESDEVGRLVSGAYADALSEMGPEQYGDPAKRAELLEQSIRKKLGETAAGRKFAASMSKERLATLASMLYGASERNMAAYGLGQFGSLSNLLTQNSEQLLGTSERLRGVEESRAKLQSALAPFGRPGFMANAVQAIMEADPDDPDASVKALLRAAGVADRKDLIGSFRKPVAELQRELIEYEKLIDQQRRSGMTPELQRQLEKKAAGIRDVVSGIVLPALESNGLAYRTSLRGEDFARYERQRNYLDRFRAGATDTNPDRARAVAAEQVRTVAEQMEAIELDPNFRLQYGEQADRRLKALRDSTSSLAAMAAREKMPVAAYLAQKNLPKEAQEQIRIQREAMSWFYGVVTQAKDADKPWAWLTSQVSGLAESANRVAAIKDDTGNVKPALSSLQNLMTMSEKDWKGQTGVDATDRARIDEARKLYSARRAAVEKEQNQRKELLLSSLKSAATIFGLPDVGDPEKLLSPDQLQVLKDRPDIAQAFIGRVDKLQAAKKLLDGGDAEKAYKLLKDSGISEKLLPSSDISHGPLAPVSFKDIFESLPGFSDALDGKTSLRETNISVNVARIEMKDDGRMTISGEGTIAPPGRHNV